MTPPSDAYRAAREAAVLIDRSDRIRIEFSGAKAVETLNGLFTNDVTKLMPGSGQYAAALTNKGKVIADVRVFALADRYLVDTSAAAGPGFSAMIKKYVNPRLASYRDVSAEFGTIGVFGAEAARVLAAAGGADGAQLRALAPFGHLVHKGGFWARVPDLGVDGFDVFAPTAVLADMRNALERSGATALDAAGADVLRVEAGRPLWGTDMDENTLAQEAALDRPDLAAISFDKGCYTGQETVARVHFRGHVNRTLRGLTCEAAPRSGARVAHGENLDAGLVRSTALSPRFGAIALAYVRREIEDGAHVAISWDGGETAAVVAPLPFA